MTGAVASPLSAARDRFWGVVAASGAAHAVAIFLALAFRPPAIVHLEQRPIMARLVRIGPERPDRLLPRREEAPPPGGEPEPTPVAAPPSISVPAPRPRPEASPAARPRGPAPDAFASALSRIRREQALSAPRPGDPSGDPAGDASTGEAGDRYLALVQRALHETYRVPATISEKDRMHLRATVILYLEPDGQVSRWTFESRSGSAAFDDALERAIRQARLPPPPADLREPYRKLGLGVRFSI